MKADSASSTALLIAASTLLTASDPATRHWVAPGAADACAQLLAADHRWLARSAVWAPTRWLWRRLEAATLPGIQGHWWHRKRWIEAQVRSAIADGLRHLVVLGAGLDSLGLRLAAEFPAQLRVSEIDHPATQALKRQLALPNLQLLPLDLATQTLPDDLFEQGPGLVIAEGLLMYLSPARVEALFVQLAKAGPQQLLFSAMVRWPDGRCGFRPYSAAVEGFLAWRREPFSWALPPEQLPAWLQGLGWQLQTQRDCAQLRPAEDPATRLAGELLLACRPFSAA